jgi:phosphomannomutase
MTAHNFHPTILREYDIRGIVDDTLHPADAKAIGLAFGSLLVRRGGTTIAVGRDGRESSPILEAALVEGLVATGLKVFQIGLGPTPMLYFATRHLKTDAGIMITGSHNPTAHNGFKIMLGKGSFFGEAIQALGPIAASGDFVSGAGTAETVDLVEAYLDRLVSDCTVSSSGQTIVWDAGNGAVGAVLRRFTDKLPGRHILLFEDVDGTFPNHHPDPSVEKNLADLKKTVLAERADFGVAFDGDGDRIGVVDSHGRAVGPDQLIALYAAGVLKTHPGATIIGDVKCSQALFEEISRLGGQPLMWKVGHSHIKTKMAEIGSPFAGEASGHIFFADRYYGFDDALYCAVRLMNLVAEAGVPLATLYDRLPTKINTPEIRFDVDDVRKFEVVAEIRARLQADGANMVDIDGVRVTTPDGWWLLRASNTQAVLVARAEAATGEGLARLKHSLSTQLAASGVVLPDESTAGH